jgi:hypothetical protein
VFVYYSGHADDQYLHLRGEPPLSHKELQDTLRGIPATIRLAVVDACKSGAVTQKGGHATGEFDVDIVSPRLSGMVLLTSSGADELSQESRALAGSVFTHHLVSGLRGAADENSDQTVTVSEAYRYAYERTRADTATSGALQRPAFRYELSGQGELVLTRLAIARYAQIRIPRGEPNKYVILDDHEWRLIAEARTAPDRDTVLTLAPGRYRVKRVLDNRLEVASITLSPGDSSDIDHLGYRAAPLSAGILKGEPSDLSPSEHHEWARARAFGVLADGQAVAALNLFDRLVHESPGDTVAWRGRGRALVRMAEAYRLVNDREREQRALNEALKSDPSLSNDPAFQSWYQLLGDLGAHDRQRETELNNNPRGGKRFGAGVDLFSARGLAAVSAAAVLRRGVVSRLGFDIAAIGFDASLLVAPLRSRWSPYVALGGHVSLQRLGIGHLGLGATGPTDASGRMTGFADEAFGWHARFEAGAEYVYRTGFTMELGIATLLYQSNDGKTAAVPLPVIHFGWLF